MCVVERSEPTPELMLCLQDLTNKIPVNWSGYHRIWFDDIMQPLLCSHLSTANRTMDTPPLNDMDLISSGKIGTSKCVNIIYLY